MKKCISIFLSLLFICNVLSVAAYADTAAAVYGESQTALLSQQIVVPISISGNPGIVGLGLRFTYDDAYLAPVSVSRGSVLSAGMLYDSIGGASTDSFDVFWSSSDNVTDDGVLFYLTFEALRAVNETTVSISYSQDDTFNEASEDVALNCSSFTVCIQGAQTLGAKGYVPGDCVAGEDAYGVIEITNNTQSALTLCLNIPAAAATVKSVSCDDADVGFTYTEGVVRISVLNIAAGTAAFDVRITLSVAADFTGTQNFEITADNSVCGYFTLSAASVGDSVVVYANDAVGEVGDIVEIPVFVKNCADLIGYRLSFSYGSAVEPVAVSNTASVGGSLADDIGAYTDHFSVLWANSSPIVSDGQILTLCFRILVKERTEILVSYSADDTFSEAGEDVALICMPIRVNCAVLPVILSQPENACVVEGTRAYFHVVASGEELTYQWQYSSNNGKTWKNSTGSGAATADLNVAGSASNANLLYRCVITNAAGSVTTAVVRVVLIAAPEIVTEPVNAVVLEGSRALFHVEASGDDLSYQWQFSTNNGKTWYNSTGTGAKTADLDIAGSAANTKYLYHCVISNAAGSVTTVSVRVVLITEPVIVTQPVNAEVTEGERAYFHVEASGENLTYQWQFSSNNGRSWYNSFGAGAATADLNVAGSAANTKYIYRCVIANEAGSAVTDSVRVVLAAAAPVIETQPVDAEVSGGARAYFHVVASGNGLAYQWQYSTDNGRTWKNSTAATATTADLNVAGSANNAKLLYRCVITNAAGSATTVSVRVILNLKPAIVTEPADAVVTEGSRAYFHVVASGADLTYQWQYSTNNGSTWKNSTGQGAATADLNVAGSANNAKLLYRCVITNAAGSATTVSVRVILTLEPVIVSQPTDTVVAAGERAYFHVVATGANLTYQWQYSKDNGKTWKNSTGQGAATADLNVAGSVSNTALIYHCVITNDHGAVTTAAVRLTLG